VIWRLVANRIATLQEIDTHYDIVEIWDANETLDILEEAEQRAFQKATQGLKK